MITVVSFLGQFKFRTKFLWNLFFIFIRNACYKYMTQLNMNNLVPCVTAKSDISLFFSSVQGGCEQVVLCSGSISSHIICQRRRFTVNTRLIFKLTPVVFLDWGKFICGISELNKYAGALVFLIVKTILFKAFKKAIEFSMLSSFNTLSKLSNFIH